MDGMTWGFSSTLWTSVPVGRPLTQLSVTLNSSPVKIYLARCDLFPNQITLGNLVSCCSGNGGHTGLIGEGAAVSTVSLVTRHWAHYENITSSIKHEVYITYRNAAIGETSDGHRCYCVPKFGEVPGF